MSKIDLVLASDSEADEANELDVKLHGKTIDKDADKLVEMWPRVMTRLEQIIDKSDFPHSKDDGYRLDTIEVHLGIEAGFTIGFAAKTNADITLTFKRPEKPKA